MGYTYTMTRYVTDPDGDPDDDDPEAPWVVIRNEWKNGRHCLKTVARTTSKAAAAALRLVKAEV